MDDISKAREERLLLHLSTDSPVDLEHGNILQDVLIPNLLEFQFRTVKAYLKENLVNGFVQQSSSPVAAPMLVATK
jgi:hypothetical protein